MPVKKEAKKFVPKKIANLFESDKAVLLLVLLLTLSILSFFWWNNISKNKAAAYVNGETIYFADYQRNFEALKKYREGQGENFSDSEKLKKLREETINTLIDKAVIIQEAAKRGINVTSSDIDNEYKALVDANKNGDEGKFKDQINQLYGFSVDEYKYYYIKSSLYEERLQEKVVKEDSYKKTAKEKIDKANQELNGGESFEKVVANYSEDEVSKSNKGDMGYIKRGQTVKEFEDVVFSLEEGSLSKVFETVMGYHVVKVTDKKSGEVRVSQVLVVVQPFDKWLDERVKESKVKIIITI